MGIEPGTGRVGQTYRFLGYTDDAGTVVSEPLESFYINADGQRVEVGEIVGDDFRTGFGGGSVSFTMPLRDVDQTTLDVLRGVRPACSKCGTPLGPCSACGGPALCGDAWCGPCQPD